MMDRSKYNDPLLPATKPSCKEIEQLFLHCSGNAEILDEKLQALITRCCIQKKLHLPGIISVNDKLFNRLQPIQTVRENLHSLNIYGTSVSPIMAVTVFYGLPNLEVFVYHDLSGFLHCADVNSVELAKGFLRNRNCKLQLGMLHDAAVRMTFSNFGRKDEKKSLELFLPANRTENFDTDIFQFDPDENGLYNFMDIYSVIVAVRPAKVFGGYAPDYNLTDLSFYSVKDIDLDLTFNKLRHLEKMLLHSCYTKISYFMEVSPHILQPNMDFHLSKSLNVLYLCNMISDDVVRLIRHCPNLKVLNLYEVELTKNLFNHVNSGTKLTLDSCYGCPVLQLVYGLHLPRYYHFVKQLFTSDKNISIRCIFVLFIIILPIWYLILKLQLNI